MKKICCFAGNSEIYGTEEIYEKLLTVTENLTADEGVTEFWVGNYGAFDKLCAKAVRKLKDSTPKYR